MTSTRGDGAAQSPPLGRVGGAGVTPQLPRHRHPGHGDPAAARPASPRQQVRQHSYHRTAEGARDNHQSTVTHVFSGDCVCVLSVIRSTFGSHTCMHNDYSIRIDRLAFPHSTRCLISCYHFHNVVSLSVKCRL